MKYEISLAPDGQLQLHMPTHTVKIPTTENGIRLIEQTLAHNNTTNGVSLFATASAPTQSMVDKWLKTNSVTKCVQGKQPAPEIKALADTLNLDELGI